MAETGYCETPPSDYDDFARGYADTDSVRLTVESPTFLDAGADGTGRVTLRRQPASLRGLLR